MKARLVHVDNNWHLLLCTGDIRVLKESEVIEFLLNFDNPRFYSGTGTWDEEEHPMKDYRGDTVAIVNDQGHMYIERSEPLRKIPHHNHTQYLTVSEYAKLHKKQNAMVRRMCQNGRIDGVVLKGKTWLIPETSPYPQDARVRK